MMRLFACAALLLSLAGCGQRGPLYLPSGPVPASQRPLVSTNTDHHTRAKPAAPSSVPAAAASVPVTP